jgi:hypothetical protein
MPHNWPDPPPFRSLRIGAGAFVFLIAVYIAHEALSALRLL